MVAGIYLFLFGNCTTAPTITKPPQPLKAPEAALYCRVDTVLIEFTHIHKDRFSNPPQKGMANVELTKDDPVAGRVVVRGTHLEGERIGWFVERGIQTSVHAVYSRKLGRVFSVDFDTALYLEELTPRQVVLRGGSTFVTDEITLRRTDGSWFWVRSNPGPPQGLELPLHDLKSTWGSQALATHLFWADDMWRSKNPRVRRQAQELYRKLLPVIDSAPALAPSKERIETRAKAEIEE